MGSMPKDTRGRLPGVLTGSLRGPYMGCFRRPARGAIVWDRSTTRRPGTPSIGRLQMRKTVLALTLVGITSPLFAQNKSDPDKNVADGGVKVVGWQARLDKASTKVEDLKFVSMGPGFHVTSGPAAIYWTPANAV